MSNLDLGLALIATLLLGYFSGRLIELAGNTMLAIKKLVQFGAITVFLGYVWGFLFPINKALWTSTYVLYTGGLAMVFLGLLLWIIDVKGLKKWAKPTSVSTPFYLLPSKSKIYYEPLGVALIIAPWNYPFQLALLPLISSIAAGNTVVIKPSEHSPHTSKLIQEIIIYVLINNDI